MSLLAIAVRAIFIYVYLCALVRLSGKRTIFQATPLDFVVGLILGDMIDDLLWAEVPASVFVAGTGSLMLAHLALSLAISRSEKLRRWVIGEPTPVVQIGEMDRQGLRRER